MESICKQLRCCLRLCFWRYSANACLEVHANEGRTMHISPKKAHTSAPALTNDSRDWKCSPCVKSVFHLWPLKAFNFVPSSGSRHRYPGTCIFFVVLFAPHARMHDDLEIFCFHQSVFMTECEALERLHMEFWTAPFPKADVLTVTGTSDM